MSENVPIIYVIMSLAFHDPGANLLFMVFHFGTLEY